MTTSPTLCSLSLPGEAPRKLAYWRWEAQTPNAPTLFCVHGLTRNGRDFDYIARSLSAHYNVICPDMAGRGKSDWLTDTKGYTYDTYFADILALLESLKLTQVDWLGTSMGGILAMRVAAERPEIIRKLVLNDIGAVIPLAGLQRINAYAGMEMAFSDRTKAEAYLRKNFAAFGIRHEEHWQHLLEHSFTRLSNGEYQLAYDPGILDPLRDAAKNLALTGDTLLWPWWDAMTCPTLVIRGESSDILTADTLEAMVQHRPALTSTLTFPDCGHAPALMEAEQITLVSNWLLA